MSVLSDADALSAATNAIIDGHPVTVQAIGTTDQQRWSLGRAVGDNPTRLAHEVLTTCAMQLHDIRVLVFTFTEPAGSTVVEIGTDVKSWRFTPDGTTVWGNSVERLLDRGAAVDAASTAWRFARIETLGES